MPMKGEGFTTAPLKCAKCQHGFIYYIIEELAAFLLEAAGNSLLLCLFLLPEAACVPQLVALLALCHLGSPKDNLHQKAWRAERSECGRKGKQSYQVGTQGWEVSGAGKKGNRNVEVRRERKQTREMECMFLDHMELGSFGSLLALPGRKVNSSLHFFSRVCVCVHTL